MNVALIHDYLTQFGGAERVLLQLHHMYPNAPIYTLLADDRVIQSRFPSATIRTSFLQSFPRLLRNRHGLLPFSAAAVERFDLRGFDVVISSTSSFAKGVLTRPETVHICYCHTPTRYLWDDAHSVMEEVPRWMQWGVRPVFQWLRVWDRQASERPTIFVANSHHTRRRIKAYYGRDAVVVYPPVGWEEREGQNAESTPAVAPLPSPYYLVVGHLRRFKRVDAVVDAFRRLDLPLVIVGDGPERKRLQRSASSSTMFLGSRNDADLRPLYRSAAAVIVPSEEDFGIVAVEAQWEGTPVLSLRRGGALETILEGVTGEFFASQNPALIADAVRRMRQLGTYDSDAIAAHGRQFPPARFRAGIQRVVERCWQAQHASISSDDRSIPASRHSRVISLPLYAVRR